MPRLIENLQVRVSQEEMATLRELGAIQQAPVSSVVRAMIRHFLLEWRAGGDLTAQLGAVVWRHSSE